MRLIQVRESQIALLIGTCLVLVLGSSVRAQSTTPAARGFVSVNGAYQATTNDFSETISSTFNVETREDRRDYSAAAGPLFGVHGGVFVWQRLAVAGGFSRFSHADDVAIAASLPHPFFFNRDRQLSGLGTDFTREEIAIDIQAVWVVPASDTIDIAVFGGPTFFTVKQDLVTGLTIEDRFPFDAPSLQAVQKGEQSESAVGFNVGADVAVYFTSHVGVGGLVRFSRAAVDFLSEAGSTLSVDAGGISVGGGLRLRF